MERAGKLGLRLFVTVSVLLMVLLIYAFVASSTPDGVTISVLGNTTKVASAGTIANLTGNSSSLPNTAGGVIFTMNITGETQNVRWKAFVGNVTGKLTLEDANGDAIYDWSLSSISGEIYATRYSSNVNWSGIGCAHTNFTEEENRLLNHSSKEDNITATFATTNNDALSVGTKTLAQNSCRTLNAYINGTTNGQDTFEEVVLYDRNSTSYNISLESGNIVYAQVLETDAPGYKNTSTFDFQMLVPERGESTWISATAYYFYVELS